MSSSTFTNWSGLVQCNPHSVEQPRDLEGIARVVRDCSAAGRNLRIVGSGHSFTDLVKTDGTILSLDNFQGLESVDKVARRATALAGTKLFRLNELLDSEGLAMENLGDINKQSIAGAVGTGTHGTGIRFGNVSSQSRAMTLVLADGSILECSEERDRDIFKAAQVSLGALGVVAKIQLQLVPSYKLNYEIKRATFDEIAAGIAGHRDNHRHFEFFLFPNTEFVLAKFLNETDEPEDGRSAIKFLNDVVIENAVFGLLCRISRAFPSFCKTSNRLCGKFVSERREVGRAHRVLSTSRMVRFNEMEYGVPADRGIDAMREIKNWIERSGVAVCFPIEFRFVKADDIWLSPSYQRDTAYISVHMYKGMDHRKYFDGVQSIFREFDGRPHWGKMHTLTAKELAPLYPMWDKFQEVRHKLDPKGLFMSPYLRALLGDVA